MTNYFQKPDALVDAVRSILSGQSGEVNETNKNDKSDDGEGLDAVQPKAVKKKFKDRKDKDIDNDGDVDSSDEYLHKRRKAVSKAMKEGVVLGEAKTDAYHKEMLKALGKSKLPKGHQYTSAIASNGDFVVYDGGKRIVGRLKKGEHSIKEGVEDNPANTQHLCAKNVVHESWGEGSCIPTMHADPDEDGNIEWYDVMFDHGIEEQVSIEELKVTKAESHIHSSYKKKIKESDDEDDEDDDDDDDMEDDENDSDEDEENGKKKKVSGKKDDVDVEPEMDDTKMVSEKEMTPAQEKKREEIVLSMKKEMPRFKKKYGDRAKDVMYATATKMAMKEGFELGIEKSDLIEEVELDEAKVTKKMIDDLEDRNEHGMVALKLAQAYGTAAEVKKVQDINKRHNQRGHIEHKDQKERDVIIRKYYKMAEEVELDEVGGAAFGGTIDKIQKVVDDKTAMKIDGVMVDTFTASLIMNIFKKVNKQNQDKMRKMKVTQLANAAYKLSGVKEEVELDEGRGRPRKDGTTGGSEDRENIQMQLRKSVSLRGLKDVEFDDGNKVKVPAKVAQGVMSKINSIKDAKQKQNAVQHIAKSHKHMMDFHKGDYKDADAKRQDILKLK